MNKIAVNKYTLIYFVGFLDLFAVSIVMPHISKHCRDLGASPTMTGLIGSVYGGIQLFSSPLVGRWSDTSGRRSVILWCLLMISIGYAVLGMSFSLWILVFSRIIVGAFKCTQDVCRCYLADFTDKSKHSQVFGTFNSISSIGFIVGPTIGGHIAEYPGGFHICAFVCASIFLFNYIFLWLLLPELPQTAATQRTKGSSNPFAVFKSFGDIDWTHMWDIFLVRFLIGLGIMVYRSNFNMWLDYNFGIKPTVAGYLTSYTGLIGTFSGFGVGFMAKYYGNDTKLLFHTGVIQMISIVSMVFVLDVYGLVLCMLPLSLANAAARVASTNVLLTRCGGQQSGALIGLGASVLSIARMLAPALGGIAQEFHSSGPVIMGAGCVCTGVLIMLLSPEFNILNWRHPKLRNKANTPEKST